MVRQRILIPCIVGSNPIPPAKFEIFQKDLTSRKISVPFASSLKSSKESSYADGITTHTQAVMPRFVNVGASE